MSISLIPVIQKLQAHARTAGVKEAPDLPIESNVAFPFSICYPTIGTIEGLPGQGEKDLTTLNLDIHTNRLDLPTDILAIVTVFEALKPLLIADPTLGDTVNTMLLGSDQPIQWTFGQMKYANVDTVGFRISIRIKQQV